MKITAAKPPEFANPNRERNEAVMNVARQFETMFVNQMVGAMRKTVSNEGLVPEGRGEKIYRSMLDYEYSKKMSESDQLGLAKVIYQQLLQGQGG